MMKTPGGGFYVCIGRMQKFIQTGYDIEFERIYYENISHCYNSLRRLGIEYNSVHYAKAISFAQRLPKSLAL